MPRTSSLFACTLALAACKPAPSVTPEPSEAIDADTPSEPIDEPLDGEQAAREPGGETDGPEPAQPEAGEDVDEETKRALSETIRAYLDDLQSCYEAALGDDSSLAGKMTYTITIQPSGSVSSVLIDLDEVGSDAVRDCATAQIEGWTFGSAEVQEEAEVTFSVNFAAV